MDEHVDDHAEQHSEHLIDHQYTGGFVCTPSPTPEERVTWLMAQRWLDTIRVSREAEPASASRAADRRSRFLAARARHLREDPGQLAPYLAPPPGAEQLTGASMGTADDWCSSARLSTTLGLAAVAAYYDRQLEAAGWRRTAVGGMRSGVLAWSAWSVTDVERARTWQGLLTVLRAPQMPQHAMGVYWLELRLLWAGARSGLGGALFE